MSKRNIDKKVIILAILVLFGGAAFTATSFCIYYLVNPLNATWLIVLCVVDFLYNLFATCLFFKIMDANKWLLKGFLLSAIYTVAFIIVAVLFTVFCGAVEFLKNNILGIIFYAFFTGPSIFIVLTIFFFCLAYV